MESDSDTSDGSEQDLEVLQAVLQNEELETNSVGTGAVAATSSHSTHQEQTSLNSIEEALALNQTLEEKYKRLEEILIERLEECRKKLEDNTKKIASASTTQKVEPFRYNSCGKPYFKDKNNISAPDNEDTILMKKAGMYDFSNVLTVPGWTVRDKRLLMNVLQEMSANIRRGELNSKIAILQQDQTKDNKNEIAQLQKEISNLKKKSFNEIALSIDYEYDWEEVALKLNRRHSPQEYRTLWRVFFHPSINKGSWHRTEHQNLERLAMMNNYQDWDLIAKNLNTGRSGYQCFVYYRTTLSNTFSGRKWTQDEIAYLKRLVDFYREDNYIPWGKVASAIENRTKIQVYNKYLRVSEERKGRFLAEEDSVILNCVNVFGTNFKRMTQYLPGRSSIQLRNRYYLLTKMKMSTTWTLQDDRKLLQIMANQDSPSNFSTATTHFPGKDRVNIRSRYLTLQKWMKKNPQADLSAAPRRGARRLPHGQANTDLQKSIEALKNRMEKEVIKTKNKKKCDKELSEAEIDESIMIFLHNEMFKPKVSLDEPTVSSDQLTQGTSDNMTNLKKLLILMHASLNKTKFMLSNAITQYHGLADDDDASNVIKVKSYSKKQVIRTIEVPDKPDIWGNNKLPKINCVLPPNLATITGCRVLMNYVANKFSSKKGGSMNLPMMARQNRIFKNQLDLLKQRFKFLFLWPIMLSNRTVDIAEGSDLRMRLPQFEIREVTGYQDEDMPEHDIPSTSYLPIMDSESTHEDMDID